MNELITADLEELSLDDPRLARVAGGEVGATKWGDDLHYTGWESGNQCLMNEMSGRHGSYSFVRAFLFCFFL